MVIINAGTYIYIYICLDSENRNLYVMYGMDMVQGSESQ